MKQKENPTKKWQLLQFWESFKCNTSAVTLLYENRWEQEKLDGIEFFIHIMIFNPVPCLPRLGDVSKYVLASFFSYSVLTEWREEEDKAAERWVAPPCPELVRVPGSLRYTAKFKELFILTDLKVSSNLYLSVYTCFSVLSGSATWLLGVSVELLERQTSQMVCTACRNCGLGDARVETSTHTSLSSVLSTAQSE